MYHQLCLKFEVQGTLWNVNIPPHSMSSVPWSAPEEKIIKPLASKKNKGPVACQAPTPKTKHSGKDDPWLQKVSCCQDYDLKVSLCFLCSLCATSLAACTGVRNWPSLGITNTCGAPEKEATRSTHLRTCNILHTARTFSWDLKRSIDGFEFRDLTACTLYDMSHGMLLGELLLLGSPSLMACR